MKKLLITMLLIFPLWGLGGCSNDDDALTEEQALDKLPEATQTGEGIFACLVNDRPYVADNEYFNCFYQYVDGEYYFTVRGSNRDENFNSYSIAIKTQQKQIFEGQTYQLVKNTQNNAFGFYGFVNMLSYTDENYTGELTITNLDEEQGIVSGTFWFDIEDHNGIVHKIRKGRFDMQFTN